MVIVYHTVGLNRSKTTRVSFLPGRIESNISMSRLELELIALISTIVYRAGSNRSISCRPMHVKFRNSYLTRWLQWVPYSRTIRISTLSVRPCIGGGHQLRQGFLVARKHPDFRPACSSRRIIDAAEILADRGSLPRSWEARSWVEFSYDDRPSHAEWGKSPIRREARKAN